MRDRLKALRDDLVPAAVRRVGVAAARRLVWELARFTLREAEARRADGRLEFHDLLVLSRALLRDPDHGVDVRRRLRARYTHLLLDEFQDTDPIQCDVAALLASGDPAAATQPWDAIVPEPGRLFVVGDPKQSIYRFRRADIGAFLRARQAFGARAVQLTRNFRSTAPVIEFVNSVFGELIRAEEHSQPEYTALDAQRDPPPVGPAVVLLGTEPDEERTGADALREAEAADVAAVIATALREGWSVARRAGDGGVTWEPCALGDICVLLPARTSLPQLESALEDAGIPYRAETSSLVYGTREIRDLLVVLQAVDDPTDELALVSALRSAVFGCGDDDLADYALAHHGRWNHQAPRPESLPEHHPVAEALAALAEWHDARTWLTPSELLERIVRDRRVLELGFAHGRPRDLWRRVRFVVEQARAFADADGGGLRDFLHWADLQGSEGSRVVETVLPETDDDAVRILTVHGAKGLEFPITVVSGMTTKALPPRNGVQLVFPHDGDGWALRLSSKLATEEFERYQPIDEQMDFHEKLRLLYVAATRAQDHLVVSVHRPAAEPRRRPPREVDPRAAALAGRAVRRRAVGGVRGHGRARGGRSGRGDRSPTRRRGRSGAPSSTPRWPAPVGPGCAPPPRSPRRPRPAPRPPRATPAWPRTHATSSCRRGTRGATAPPSAARCTRSSRPPISPPARASTPPPPRRPRPKA